MTRPKASASAEGFETLQKLATGHVLGVPVPFVLLLIIALIMGIVLHRSVYGRYLYAVGRNEEAARYSGVNSKRIIAGAYVIMGLLAAISAILDAFYTNSISPSSRRHVLRALRHRGGGSGRMQPAGRRRLHYRHPSGSGAAASASKSGQPARH